MLRRALSPFLLIGIFVGIWHQYQRVGPQIFPALIGRGVIIRRSPHYLGDADQQAARAAIDEPYNPWGKAPPPSDPANPTVPQAMVLARDGSGQFHVMARVNGRDVRFLVDTGADMVALTPQTAQDLGLNVRPDDYRPILRTASGMGMGAVVMLGSVELVGRREQQQRAVVAQGLSENLLGQSVLRRLGQLEMKGDTMRLVPW